MTLAYALCMLTTGDKPDKPGPIAPDRPSFTNATQIAPLGHLIYEMGFRQTQFGRSTVNDLGDGATFLFAVRENLELHIGIPSLLAIHGGGSSASGSGDEDLAFKWRITPDPSGHRWGFALEGDALIPIGSRAFRGPRVQPLLTAIGSYLPDGNSEVDANILMGWPSDPVGAYLQWGASVAYSRNLTSNLALYGEAYLLAPQVGRNDRSAYADAGVMKWLCDRVAVDAYFGQGFNGMARDRFFGAGVSIRF